MKAIQFKQNQHDHHFIKALKREVDAYFSKGKMTKKANKKAKIKALLFFSVYALLSISLFLTSNILHLYLNYSLLGVVTIFLALNLAHDAAHGTFSKKKSLNKLFLYTFDLLGASSYIWKKKHVHSHHPFVNIQDVDLELKQNAIVRIFPNSDHKWFHRYQAVYMPLVYLFYTFFWMCFRDFKEYFEITRSGRTSELKFRREFFKLLTGKFLFVLRMLLLPYILLPFTIFQISFGFMIFHFSASFVVALALVSTHVVEHSVYPNPDKKGQMPQSWVRHQILTTCDFATGNTLISHLFGSFNHHVIHHLFPNICHIHYPELTKILKRTCEKYSMPYFSNPTLLSALRSHFKFLKIRSMELKKVSRLEM